MITVGRAPRAAASAHEVVEQVQMAEVEAVEHADDDEHGPELRPEPLDAG